MVGEVPVRGGGRDPGLSSGGSQNHSIGASRPCHFRSGIRQRVREVAVVVGVPAVAAVVSPVTLGYLCHHVIVLHKRIAWQC